MHLESDDDAALVLDGLRRIVHGLRTTAHVVERDVGLTGAQAFVLRELAAEPNVSIRRLSERTLTDPSSASVVVARLVELRLVSRRSDPADARKSVLAVTKRGQALLARAPEPYQARLFAALRALPKKRLRQLRVGLTALLEASTGTRGSAPLFFEDVPKTKKTKNRERGPRRAR